MVTERRRALLIGAPTRGLQGVLSDVRAMRFELGAWWFECVECVGDHATRDEILKALRDFVAQTQSGDVVVIYYSGHGGRCRVAGADGTSSGPAWSYLVPMDHDFKTSFRGIAEVELGVVVNDLAARTPNVTVILDCCHAATMARQHERLRALPDLPFVPPLLQAAMDEHGGAVRVLGPDGHPDVVRVVATGSDASAFELCSNGRSTGYLTSELCAALAEARVVPQTWESIIGQVRERIMARRGSDTQRPEVEGPRRRLPFSLVEPPGAGEHAALAHDAHSVPWIRAGRLHGLREGDPVEVHTGGPAVVVTGRIVAAFEDSAQLELHSRQASTPPRPGNTVVVRQPTLRCTVRVETHALSVAGLVTALERSQRLLVVGQGRVATFVVERTDGGLTFSGPEWLRRVPWPVSMEGVEALAADLDRLARAEVLLAQLANPRGLPGPSAERWKFEVMVTEPETKTPRPLRPREVLREHTRLYVELRHLVRAKPTLYVNVLERGVAGRLALVNQSEPAGVQLSAGEMRWVGRRAHGGPPGARLEWPKQVPRGGIGWQSLSIIVSQRPLDLRSLLEGPLMASSSTTRAIPGEELGTELHWAVERVEFGLVAAEESDVRGRGLKSP